MQALRACPGRWSNGRNPLFPTKAVEATPVFGRYLHERRGRPAARNARFRTLLAFQARRSIASLAGLSLKEATRGGDDAGLGGRNAAASSLLTAREAAWPEIAWQYRNADADKGNAS
jgi:hypothetical protein